MTNRKWFQVNHDRAQPCGKRRQSSGNPGRFVTSLSLLSIQHGGQQADRIVDPYTCWLNYYNSLQKSPNKQKGDKISTKNKFIDDCLQDILNVFHSSQLHCGVATAVRQLLLVTKIKGQPQIFSTLQNWNYKPTEKSLWNKLHYKNLHFWVLDDAVVLKN